MFSNSGSFSNSWQTLIKSVGIENSRWHNFRHCCGSYLSQDGKDLGIIGKVTSSISLLPVQRVIRTFLEKRLLRLMQPFPRSCMNKQNRMQTKMHTKYDRRSASLANAGFANIVPRVRIPLSPPQHYSILSHIIPDTSFRLL